MPAESRPLTSSRSMLLSTALICLKTVTRPSAVDSLDAGHQFPNATDIAGQFHLQAPDHVLECFNAFGDDVYSAGFKTARPFGQQRLLPFHNRRQPTGQVGQGLLGGGVLENDEERCLLFEGADICQQGSQGLLPSQVGPVDGIRLSGLGFQSGPHRRHRRDSEVGQAPRLSPRPSLPLTAMMPARPQQSRLGRQGKRITAGPDTVSGWRPPKERPAIVRNNRVPFGAVRTTGQRCGRHAWRRWRKKSIS